jgi:hypothetical protein
MLEGYWIVVIEIVYAYNSIATIFEGKASCKSYEACMRSDCLIHDS